MEEDGLNSNVYLNPPVKTPVHEKVFKLLNRSVLNGFYIMCCVVIFLKLSICICNKEP